MSNTNKKTSTKVRKPAKPPNRAPMVSVEVLQNGISVAQTSHRYGKTGTLAITSKPNGPLAIPMYPLPDEVVIVKSSRGKTFLRLDNAWEGFVVLEGAVKEVIVTDRTLREFELKPGDYASLLLGDLRVLVRVAPEKRAIIPDLDKNFRPAFSSLFLRDKNEFAGFAAAAGIAFLLFASFSWGLLRFHAERPKNIEDLSALYTLPFISSEHFVNSPETLQEKLNRHDYVASVVRYYRDFSAMVSGLPVDDTNGMFSPTINAYQESFREAKSKLEFLSEKQKKIEDAALKRPLVGVLAIPSVEGETVDGSLLRIIDKVALQHDAAKLNLQLRKEVSDIFKADPEYDFNQYKGKIVVTSGLDKIKQISLMEMTDEQEMYVKGERLGLQAAALQRRTSKVHEKFSVVSAKSGPIEIPAGVEFASFLSGVDYILADEKLDQIQASEFGTQRRIEVIKEPLIGEIEPSLVEKTIEKYRFELQLCFELALRRNQLTRGVMEWKWRIDSRGQISDISLVSTTIVDQRMTECVRDKMGKWRFPRPRRGSIEVSYPFEFNPSRG